MLHPGGLDANGGHTDSKTGKYHIHKPGGHATTVAPAETPATSPRTFHAIDDGVSRPVRPPEFSDVLVPLGVVAAIAGVVAWFIVSRVRKAKRWWNRKWNRVRHPFTRQLP